MTALPKSNAKIILMLNQIPIGCLKNNYSPRTLSSKQPFLPRKGVFLKEIYVETSGKNAQKKN